MKEKEMKIKCEEMERAKKKLKLKRLKKNLEINKDKKKNPCKVLFPGQHRIPGSTGYGLRQFKDPRLEFVLKRKLDFYKLHGIKDDDDDDHVGSSSDEDEDEDEDESKGKSIAQLRKELKRAVKMKVKELRERDYNCAEAAIKFYNEEHGTDYKIVETLGSFYRLYVGFWFHCNFRAQHKSDTSSPPSLFFAELCCKQANTFVVKACKPLDGIGKGCRTVRGCYLCRNHLLHPVNGFQKGKTETPRFII